MRRSRSRAARGAGRRSARRVRRGPVRDRTTCAHRRRVRVTAGLRTQLFCNGPVTSPARPRRAPLVTQPARPFTFVTHVQRALALLASPHARQRRHFRHRGHRQPRGHGRGRPPSGLPVFTVVGLPDAAVREARERVRAALLNSGSSSRSSGSPRTSPRPTCARPAPASTSRSPSRCWRRAGQVPADDARRARGCRRAVARRRAARRSAGSLAMATGARAGRLRAADRAGRERRRGGAGRRASRCSASRPASAWCELLQAARPAGPRVARAPARRRAERARPRRRPRPGRRQARARDRGRRRPQPADGRPARRRQDDARAPPARHPAAADAEEALEITRIHSVAGPSRRAAALASARSARRTTRSQPPGLVGGGSRRGPGEITLAHRGVLFLDELAEFSRRRSRRCASRSRRARVESRAAARARLPGARCMLVGACNACPCARREARVRLHATDRRALPAPAQRPAARPHRPGLPARAGAGRSSCVDAGERGGTAARSRPRSSRPASASASGWPDPVRSQRRDGRPADPALVSGSTRGCAHRMLEGHRGSR